MIPTSEGLSFSATGTGASPAPPSAPVAEIAVELTIAGGDSTVSASRSIALERARETAPAARPYILNDIPASSSRSPSSA